MVVLSELRRAFHKALLDSGVLSSNNGIASNADRGNGPSVRLAASIYDQISAASTKASEKLAGQTAGANFELICANFIAAAFADLNHLRPGEWLIGRDGIQGKAGVADFEQYAHLAKLASAAEKDSELRAILGSDYLIKPDVLVARQTISDEQINAQKTFVDESVAKKTPIRRANSSKLALHATISCKWTMRSDRAQNARTEALNLMKNRKGRVPHISVITAEPTPGRLASLAFGTGEIDCVYHFALDELVQAVAEDKKVDDGTLSAMIEGNRLRDIADLPLDLIA
ncbi:MAG: NgoMIV family type II restriction endonuclease [Rhizobiaceae bacterium]